MTNSSNTNTDSLNTDPLNSINTGLGTVATDTYDYANNLLSNPSLVIILVTVIILYIILFMYLGKNGLNTDSNYTSESSSSTNTISIIVIALFIILVILNGFQYFFGVDIIASIKNILSGNPEIDITIDKSISDNSRLDAAKSDIPQILLRPQVFNIPGNTYIYSDAKALCSAYGSKLATYQQVEDSYKNGGEWCNYGWSEGQMALFPTQQKTFDDLQKIEGHENDCGRPGINGGYISNPAIKFGVNCYGYKPRMTPEEEDIMANRPIYPKTMKDIAMENRVKYWKDKLNEILVSPFNHKMWSKI
jgi:hypothetical protein